MPANSPPMPVYFEILNSDGSVAYVLIVDATKQETHTFSASVTDHPVEKGSDISDHTRSNPDLLTLECVISDDPLYAHGDYNDSHEADKVLRSLVGSGILCNIITSLRPYSKCLIESVSEVRDAGKSNGLFFTVSWKQIRTVENKLTAAVKAKTPKAQKKVDTGGATPETKPAKDQSVIDATAHKILDALKGAFST